jgi:type IV secretory pathway VirD2 relaxase
MSIQYHKSTVTVIFKTSDRSNAKTKIKSFRNKSIDDILDATHLTGIPDNAVILEIGLGHVLETQYRKKYKL